MNTQENNKLIAEFMGFQKTNIGWYDFQDSLPEYAHILNGGNTFDTLQFEVSWDWLMPVIEKIESDERYDVDILQYGTRITNNQKEIVNNIADISFDKKIDHTYQAVVEFINQYKK
tara:strand:- start:1400 stop:1747 length:348 start_codon:yes stop_codon:yes gene_type:complete